MKDIALKAARLTGGFGVLASSRWRRNRLLILCYHGLSLRDEHEWSNLYVTPEHFRNRMSLLRQNRCAVLSLGSAIEMLQNGSLPPKSVAITFDDGFYDFYEHGLPVLREFGFPATVYQTTYYCAIPYPIYNVMLSYLLWRGRASGVTRLSSLGGAVDLTQENGRATAVAALRHNARAQHLSEDQKHQVASEIAEELKVDYPELVERRMLRLMTYEQVAEIAAAGIDVQLHTHRHRTPMNEQLFVREIRENRAKLAAISNTPMVHFCYPSGVYRPEFFSWLKAENIATATTCDLGIVGGNCDLLQLPRVLDSMFITADDFEGWLSGFSALLPHRR